MQRRETEEPGAFKYTGAGCGRPDLTEGEFAVDSAVSKKCRKIKTICRINDLQGSSLTALWLYDKVKSQQLVDTTDTGKECREGEEETSHRHRWIRKNQDK